LPALIYGYIIFHSVCSETLPLMVQKIDTTSSWICRVGQKRLVLLDPTIKNMPEILLSAKKIYIKTAAFLIELTKQHSMLHYLARIDTPVSFLLYSCH